jgi:hypothetical protein
MRFFTVHEKPHCLMAPGSGSGAGPDLACSAVEWLPMLRATPLVIKLRYAQHTCPAERCRQQTEEREIQTTTAP